MVITRSSNSRRRGENSCSSVSTTPHLPMDLILDILSRLPVKPLIRFKSVAKSWYNLINSPSFIHNHQEHSKMNPNPIFSAVLSVPQSRNTNKYVFRLNLIDALDKPMDIESPFMSERCFRVLGICDGLVCVLLRDESSDIIVCNPATGRFRKIPPFDDSPWYNDCIFFGFGSSANGYELFRIDYESVRIKANSFSLGTNTWRDIRAKMGKFGTYSDPTAFVEPLRCFEAVPILRNRVFYWEGHDVEEGRVLSFDVFNEVLDEIWAPDDTLDADWELRELKDELALVIYHSRRLFDVWVLNENEKTWMLKESIDVNDRLTEFPGDNRVKVLGCARNGDLVLEDHDDNNSRLYLYDMDTNDVYILPYVNADGNHEVCLYTESLVSVDTSNGVAEADSHLA